MTRWAPDARERLEHAALDLFARQGFAATTVPQIAEQAGLTTRTFFRHFSDKREVIFAGDEIPERARRMLRDAPPGLDALAVIRGGLGSVAVERFEGRRERVRRVRALILQNPALAERDLRKRADLAAAIRDGLIARGEEPLSAALLAELAVTTLHVAIDRWLEDPLEERSLASVVSEVLDAYRSLLREPSSARTSRGREDDARE